MAYSLVRYEFEGPGCKSRESGDWCILQAPAERETGVPGSSQILWPVSLRNCGYADGLASCELPLWIFV
jgi:hypothetical protein